METNYLCPKCNSYLRVRDNIILTFKCVEKKSRGIILINSHLGNYSFIIHPDTISFEAGDVVDFYCPVCFELLTATEIDDKLVKIIRMEANRKKYDIYFTRIAGEHATFKIEENNIIEQFGKDSSGYKDYFSAKLHQALG